jgi:restriction system protein
LVLKVLSAMGYGKDGSLEGTAASRDGGIDGIISQDPLGLDRIYLQAKRFTGSSVQSQDVQAFIGALSTSHGDRGVFITTSIFTKGAREAADRSTVRIELIDGRQLVKLMVNYKVGVQPESETIVYKIDEDFFEGI